MRSGSGSVASGGGEGEGEGEEEGEEARWGESGEGGGEEEAEDEPELDERIYSLWRWPLGLWAAGDELMVARGGVDALL